MFFSLVHGCDGYIWKCHAPAIFIPRASNLMASFRTYYCTYVLNQTNLDVIGQVLIDSRKMNLDTSSYRSHIMQSNQTDWRKIWRVQMVLGLWLGEFKYSSRLMTFSVISTATSGLISFTIVFSLTLIRWGYGVVRVFPWLVEVLFTHNNKRCFFSYVFPLRKRTLGDLPHIRSQSYSTGIK